MKFGQDDVMQIFKAELGGSHVAFDDQGNLIIVREACPHRD